MDTFKLGIKFLDEISAIWFILSWRKNAVRVQWLQVCRGPNESFTSIEFQKSNKIRLRDINRAYNWYDHVEEIHLLYIIWEDVIWKYRQHCGPKKFLKKLDKQRMIGIYFFHSIANENVWDQSLIWKDSSKGKREIILLAPIHWCKNIIMLMLPYTQCWKYVSTNTLSAWTLAIFSFSKNVLFDQTCMKTTKYKEI